MLRSQNFSLVLVFAGSAPDSVRCTQLIPTEGLEQFLKARGEAGEMVAVLEATVCVPDEIRGKDLSENLKGFASPPPAPPLPATTRPPEVPPSQPSVIWQPEPQPPTRSPEDMAPVA